MLLLRPYHFTRPQPQGFLDFYERVRACGGVVCFDLEDSVFSPDQAKCRALKAHRRREVMTLLKTLENGSGPSDLFVRVNAPGTEDYDLDLRALCTLKRLPGLFLPKTESAENLAVLLRAFSEPPPSIIPVVESRAGFASLHAILTVAHRSFTSFAFGHCDYNLDCGHFPFYHQDAEQYWPWIGQLDTAARVNGKGVLNSPLLRLNDRMLFQSMLNRLADFPTVRGQITLSMDQTRQCAAALPQARYNATASGDEATDSEVAHQVVCEFERHQVVGSYFALNGERTIISPHEYKAAQHFSRP